MADSAGVGGTILSMAERSERSLLERTTRIWEFATAVGRHGWTSVQRIALNVLGLSVVAVVLYASDADPLTVIGGTALAVFLICLIGAYKAWDAEEVRASVAERERDDAVRAKALEPLLWPNRAWAGSTSTASLPMGIWAVASTSSFKSPRGIPTRRLRSSADHTSMTSRSTSTVGSTNDARSLTPISCLRAGGPSLCGRDASSTGKQQSRDRQRRAFSLGSLSNLERLQAASTSFVLTTMRIAARSWPRKSLLHDGPTRGPSPGERSRPGLLDTRALGSSARWWRRRSGARSTGRSQGLVERELPVSR